MLRNVTLDYLKIGLSFLVVSIHVTFFRGLPDEFTGFVLDWLFANGIARVAVPCFFIINGYFVNISDKSKFIKYIKHLLILYVVWMLIYLPAYKDVLVDFSQVGSMFFFGYSHLWYVAALILGSLLLYGLNKLFKGNSKYIFRTALVLFLCGYLLQVGTQLKYPYAFQLLFRNFLVLGFPFIAIGHLLKTSKPLILSKHALRIIGGGFIVLLFESCLSMKYKVGIDFYLSLFILCPAIIVYVLDHAKWEKSTRLISDMSSAIYFSHMGVFLLIRFYLGKEGYILSDLYLYPIVLVTTIIVSYIICKLNKRVKILL